MLKLLWKRLFYLFLLFIFVHYCDVCLLHDLFLIAYSYTAFGQEGWYKVYKNIWIFRNIFKILKMISLFCNTVNCNASECFLSLSLSIIRIFLIGKFCTSILFWACFKNVMHILDRIYSTLNLENDFFLLSHASFQSISSDYWILRRLYSNKITKPWRWFAVDPNNSIC